MLGIYTDIQNWLNTIPDYSGWYWITLPVLVLLSGWIYRLRGGATTFGVNLLRATELTLWSLLVVLPVLLVAPLWQAIVAFAFTFLFTSLGHGDGIDFGHNPRRDPDEWPSVLIRFFNKLTGWDVPNDGYLHDTLYMVFNGISITFVTGIIGVVNIHWLFVLGIFAGATKGLAYFIGWKITDKYGSSVADKFPNQIRPPTAFAEFLTGVFTCSILYTTYLLII